MAAAGIGSGSGCCSGVGKRLDSDLDDANIIDSESDGEDPPADIL